MTTEPRTDLDAVEVPADVTAAAESKASVKSKRGRRIAIAVLVLLVLLLLLATAFLLNLISPKGNISSAKAAGGVTWVRSIYGYGDAFNQQLVAPSSVAFESDGDLIIPNTGVDAIRGLRFANSGVFKNMFAGSKEGWLAFPGAVDVAPDGKMYFVQGQSDEIIVTNRSGNKTERVIKVQKPTSIDVAKDRIAIGALSGWVVTDLQGKIILGPVGSRGDGVNQYDVVGGIAIDNNNNIFVVDTYNNRISKFNAEGKRLWIMNTGSPSNKKVNAGGNSIRSDETTSPAKMQTPGSIIFDGAGRLLVVDPFDFSIAAFNPSNGKFIAKWGAFGAAEGKFMYPSGIAYDPVRDWIAVADTMNNRVQIIRLPGTGGSATSGLARTLTGPIRACLFPFLLLVLALIVWAVMRYRKRAAARKAALAAAQTTDVPAPEVQS